ncbi:MAG TPA: N-formylglutamate amidohydrolase, partial [Novosphingobium sp.]
MTDDSNAVQCPACERAGSAPPIPGTDGVPAFSTAAVDPSVLPVVIAVPHGGRAYPPRVLAQLRDSAASRLRLEDRLVDRLGEAVAQATGAPLIVAHAPRAVIDLNRAADDIDWGMVAGRPSDRLAPSASPSLRGRARSGLGLVPRRLPGTGEIWKTALDPAELTARI